MAKQRRYLFERCLSLVFLLSLFGAHSAVLAEVSAIGHRIYVDRKPFLIAADTGWTVMTRIGYEDAEYYLSVRKNQGFNTILADIIPAKSQGNFYGDKPFFNNDMTRPNSSYWLYVDRVVRNMVNQGFLMVLKTAPICCNWGKGNKFNPVSAKVYGRFLGKRYSKYNIIWEHCGDWNPAHKTEAILALIQGIRETAPKQLHTCHPRSPHSAADVLPDKFVDLNLTYTYRPDAKDVGLPQYHVYDRSRRDYNRFPAKPFYLGESDYESPYGDIPTQLLRRLSFWSILSGSTGFSYGHYFSCVNSKGWKDILNAKGAEDMRHVKDVFLRHNWVNLIPDQKHSWVISGYGTYNGTTKPGGDDYVTAAYTPDGRLLMAYVPVGNTLSVDLRRFSGEVNVKWFDPTNGSYSSIGKFSNHSIEKFSIPGENQDGDRDWVFIAETSNSDK